MKVCVFQTDNRPTLNYLLESQKVNRKMCDLFGFDYLFIQLDDHKYDGYKFHPATKKIHIVNDLLQSHSSKYDILVFLDSDAWIQNGHWLKEIIQNLMNDPQKHGCFSRDPYLKIATFINSGSFIIKMNDFTKCMYRDFLVALNSNVQFHKQWPYDQHYISNYIFEHKDKFTIFVPDVLNTPVGKVLRHNWAKNQKMYNDLKALYETSYEGMDKSDFNEKKYYDDKEFPNPNDNGCRYLN